VTEEETLDMGIHRIVTLASAERHSDGLRSQCEYLCINANGRWLVIPRFVLIQSRCCRCQAPLLLRGDEHCAAQDLAALARLTVCDRCSRSRADARPASRSRQAVKQRVAHRGVYLD
jgi:hypothetical protein